MKTYFALSDIHGRKISLQDFEKKGFMIDNVDHMIVLVGDYFDRYEFNEEVLVFCEEMLQCLKDRFIMIKGNHDEFIMEFVAELEAYKVGDVLDEEKFNLERWLRNGGRITIDQLFGEINGTYTEEKFKKVERLKLFLNHIQDYYETDNYIFTHAGIDEERYVDVWNREFFHTGFNTKKTTIIGHTTYEYLEDFTLLIKQYEDFDEFQLAISNKKTQSLVYDIDNGNGNNIAVFSE